MTETTNNEDQPPILGSWKTIYLIVLGNLAALIILFSIITKHFS